jgi:hypothetical protein
MEYSIEQHLVALPAISQWQPNVAALVIFCGMNFIACSSSLAATAQVVQAWLQELLLRHPVLDACAAASAAAAAATNPQQQQQQQGLMHEVQAGGYMFGALPGMTSQQQQQQQQQVLQQQKQKHKRQLTLDVHITGRRACRQRLSSFRVDAFRLAIKTFTGHWQTQLHCASCGGRGTAWPIWSPTPPCMPLLHA